jgi:GH18 family chitinase
LGLPAFGRTFKLANEYKNDLGSLSFRQQGLFGNYTQTQGFLSYFEVCQLKKKQDWTNVWLDHSKTNYMFNKNDWISYDDTRSFHMRAAYVVSKKLGGIFIW